MSVKQYTDVDWVPPETGYETRIWEWVVTLASALRKCTVSEGSLQSVLLTCYCYGLLGLISTKNLWDLDLEQGLTNCVLLSVFVNKILLECSQIHSFSIAHRCFSTPQADWRSQDKDCMAHKASRINYLAPHKTILITPGLKCASELSHSRGKVTAVSVPDVLSCRGWVLLWGAICLWPEQVQEDVRGVPSYRYYM